MRIRRSANLIEITAPAKLNLFLEVHGKTRDGFHELETVMCKVSMFDTIYFEPRPESPGYLSLKVEQVGPGGAIDPVPTGDTNLLVRAVKRLRQEHDIASGARLRLVKRIPTQAGLGGGSSDAAAGLVAANLGWNLGMSREALAKVAAELGSDVPFFLFSSPAVCRGRGERVSAFSGRFGPRHFLIVKPDDGLPTAEVFAQLTRNDGILRTLPRAIEPSVMFNRLQGPAMELCEALAPLQRSLGEIGLSDHLMTGSGSSLFAVCRSRRAAIRSAHRLRQLGWPRVFATDAVLD